MAPPHHLHFLSDAAKAEFASRVPRQSLGRHACHVLTNCSDLGPIKPAARPAHPTLLMSGRSSYQKNHMAAVELLAALPSNYRLILCGEGTETLAPLFEQHQQGLSKRVQFVGPVADVRPLLAEADLFLLPSRYEGMPLAALEAFEAGLPVVLSDTPGMSEILATHPLAHPMDIRNPAGSAGAVAQLVDHFRANPNIRRDIHAAWEKAFSKAHWRDGAEILLTKFSTPPDEHE
nr:glycosyltransferase [Roseovarius bejariae]